MNISGAKYHQNQAYINTNQAQNVSFKATLSEITDSFEKSDKLCEGKKTFIRQLLAFLSDIQDQMKEKVQQGKNIPAHFNFKLGEMNQIPPALKKLNVEGAGLDVLDKKLNDTSFSCGPESDCSCGKGQSLGEFLSKTILGKILKVPNPDVIELKTD
jgi:hypothetical protein